MAEHTPLPWKKCGGATPQYMAIHSVDGYIVFGMADGMIDRENGHPILTPDFVTQANNAAFIVRACNCHDDLLAACEAALETIAGGSYHNAPSAEMLRQAIAKAKEPT